jgi:hypothetical protein
MKAIRAYPARKQAERAKRALDDAAILTLVIDDPRTKRVQLWVPDELADHARALVDLAERWGHWTLSIAA